MTWNVLTIRTAEHEDGSLYPVIGDDSCPIELEPLDGNVQTIVATSLTVHELAGGSLRQIARVADIRAELVITDSRVAVACSKYDKGGGWTGFGSGAVLAIGLNAVSKARAAHRRKGKMLVGQVRYPWVRSIGASARTGWTTSEALRFTVVSKLEGQERHLLLTAGLPKDISATAAAQEIVHRAAHYRLAHTAVRDEDAAGKLTALASAGRLTPEAKKFAFYELPTYFNVSPLTAYPADQAAGEA